MKIHLSYALCVIGMSIATLIGCNDPQPTSTQTVNQSSGNIKNGRQVLTGCDGTFTDLFTENGVPGDLTQSQVNSLLSNGWHWDSTTTSIAIGAHCLDQNNNQIILCGTIPAGTTLLKDNNGGSMAVKAKTKGQVSFEGFYY
ncbi:MAG: hypothetical protein ABIR47_17965 [Candidatus Kapaibacterium sp.]